MVRGEENVPDMKIQVWIIQSTESANKNTGTMEYDHPTRVAEEANKTLTAACDTEIQAKPRTWKPASIELSIHRNSARRRCEPLSCANTEAEGSAVAADADAPCAGDDAVVDLRLVLVVGG